MGSSTTVLVGLISDTHGLLRPEVLETLRGVDRILHAGDIGGAFILRALSEVAPVTAVRGNTDTGEWARAFPVQEVVEIGGVLLGLVHDGATLDLDPRAAGLRAVISGHSHRPSVERRGEVFFVNPGAAGPRRFALPVTVGLLRISSGEVSAEIRYLDLQLKS